LNRKRLIIFYKLGLSFAAIPPDNNFNSDMPILDINQVRILPMSHKYNPARVHVGLLIYSVDGQTDFILNDANLRIKTGDILIHQTHHALSGQEDAYRDLIRSLFGTHRINLIGLVFTFTGNGQFNDCMRWMPTSANHTSPMHPTEQKLLEIVLISLYMNHEWLSMPMASHIDVEALSQSTKKLYLLKLGKIEGLFNKRRKERQPQHYLPIPKFLKSNQHHSSDSFRSFEWTPNRQQIFDETIQRLLDELYNVIQQAFQDEEFDRDQYTYYDDSTKELFSNLINPYERLQIKPAQNYYAQPQNAYLYRS
jgi:hypothetical protein